MKYHSEPRRKACVMKAQKNILLFLWSREGSGRDFLTGFSSYYRRKTNWNVSLLCNADILQPDTLMRIKDGFYDGIVMTEMHYYAHPELSGPSKTALAIFGIHETGHAKEGNRIGYVCVDNAKLGRAAAIHFLGLGRFRSFCFIPPASREPWDMLREQGFKECLSERGLPCRTFDYSQPIAHFLRLLPAPIGMLVASDYTAVETLSACKHANFNIPAQLAILGIDNEELLCQFATPTLSSIRPAHVEAGQEAAAMLERLMRKPPSRTPLLKVCPECTIIERESTRHVSPASHIVEQALITMKENLSTPLRVDGLAKQLGVSRSLLDLRFRELHGESVYRTYMQLKLDEISQRLLTSSVSIGKVAASLSLYDLTQLGRLFKRRFGVTMSEWRTSHDHQ